MSSTFKNAETTIISLVFWKADNTSPVLNILSVYENYEQKKICQIFLHHFHLSVLVLFTHPLVSLSLTQTCIIAISGKILLTFYPWVSVTCGGAGWDYLMHGMYIIKIWGHSRCFWTRKQTLLECENKKLGGLMRFNFRCFTEIPQLLCW